MKAAEDGLLYLHPWVINDWVECGAVQLSLGEMDHWRRSGGVWRPSYFSRLPSCKRTWKMYERCVYPNVWVQAYCMCHCKSAPGNGGGTCGCERLTFVVSGRLSCSIVDVWWEPTVLPIDPLMGARCRWSQTGHAWCINSTAWAWGWGGVGGEKRNKGYKCFWKVIERWMAEFDRKLLRRLAHLAAWELAEVRFEILSDHCVNGHQTEYAGLPDAALRVVVTLSKPEKAQWKKPAGFLVTDNRGFFHPTSNIWRLCVLPVWVLALFQAAGWSDRHGEPSPSLWSASWWQLGWWGSQLTGWWDTTPWYTGPDWWTTPTWPPSPLLLVPPLETGVFFFF